MTSTAALRPHRPELLALVERAEAAPGSDEAYFLGQLRAAIAGLEGQATPFAMRTRAPRFGREASRERA
jgi:hypothetical protein